MTHSSSHMTKGQQSHDQQGAHAAPTHTPPPARMPHPPTHRLPRACRRAARQPVRAPVQAKNVRSPQLESRGGVRAPTSALDASGADADSGPRRRSAKKASAPRAFLGPRAARSPLPP
eukprot:842625-Prymnesium_polylepis.1